jgi:trehalose-6-phosphate synthase
MIDYIQDGSITYAQQRGGKNELFTRRTTLTNGFPLNNDLSFKRSGGVQNVVIASQPSYWVGPMAVSDKAWNEMTPEQRRTPVVYDTGPDTEYDVIGVPIPESVMEHMHYRTVANGVWWPFAHSRQPTTTAPLEVIEDAYFNGYLKFAHYMGQGINLIEQGATLPLKPMKGVSLPPDVPKASLEEIYGKEKVSSEKAHEQLPAVRLSPFESKDSVWTHDYQCVSAPGALFSWHIPWPSLEEQKKMTLTSYTLEGSEKFQPLAINDMNVDEPASRDMMSYRANEANRYAKLLRKPENILEQEEYEDAKTGLKAKRYRVLDPESRKSVFVLERKVPLIQTQMYRDFVESLTQHHLLTLQRPIDQANYIMTLALLDQNSEKGIGFEVSNRETDKPHNGKVILHLGDGGRKFTPDFVTNNPGLIPQDLDINNPADHAKIQQALMKRLTIGSALHITAFGDRQSVMNIPVGNNNEDIHLRAGQNENLLNKSVFYEKPEPFDKKGNPNEDYTKQLAKYERGRKDLFQSVTGEDPDTGERMHAGVNLTGLNPDDYVDRAPTVKEILAPIRGRKWALSGHRNDYTKGTLVKLEAWEKLLERQHDLVENGTLLMGLQPTRTGVEGYREYADSVFKKVHEIREKFGEKSVVIIPQMIDPDDFLAMMRQKEVQVFLSLGDKDGHDLTAREFVDANKSGAAKALICSEGIGAADVLRQDNKGAPGALIIQDPKNAQQVADAMAFAFDEKNRNELSRRFRAMKKQSAAFNIDNYTTEIEAEFQSIMREKFGDRWQHPETPRTLQDVVVNRLGETSFPPPKGSEEERKARKQYEAALYGPVNGESGEIVPGWKKTRPLKVTVAR